MEEKNILNDWNPYRSECFEINAVEMLYNFFKHHGQKLDTLERIFKSAMEIQESQLKKAYTMGYEKCINDMGL